MSSFFSRSRSTAAVSALLLSVQMFSAILASGNTAALAEPEAAAALNSAPGGRETIGVTPDEVTVGSCAPLSGQMKLRGGQVVAGGRAYFSHINDQGGVNGRKIKLVSCDDQYNASVAINCFDTCLKNKVFLGTLFEGTAAATKYVPMSDLNHLPTIGFSMGAQFIVEPTHPYAFQVRAALSGESAEQIDTLWNKLGIRRIAIVYQNDAYGAACRRGTLTALAKYHAVPAAEASFARLSETVDDVIKTLHDAKPQALILGASGDALPLIVKRRNDIGPHVLLVGMSVGTDLLTQKAGPAANGTLVTQVVPLTQTDLPTVKLYEKVLKQYEHTQPSISSFEGFIIAMVVVEGLKRAGKNLTRDGFVNALEGIKDKDMGLGPKFKLTYGHDDHDGFDSGVYWTMIKDGKVENVTDWKPFMAQAK